MSELYIIKDLGDYRIFLPPSTYCATSNKPKRDNRKAANLAFIENNPGVRPKQRISGTFIYAHPPNYRGAEAFRYTREDWFRELSRIKGHGMDTVIFQASLWNELQECYYPSEYFKNYRSWNVVEPMLESAAELGLDVFLGGYGSVTCWQDKLNVNVIDNEIQHQLACFRELMRYRKNFKGFYFSPESAFPGTRNTELENFLGELYYRFFSEIRDTDSGLKIMMSPATFYYPDGIMNQMRDAWQAMFARACPDILAPQDSIGCGGITLNHQDEAFRIWSAIADECGIELWSNVEIFECCQPYIDENARRSASPERVICQINNAAPYVKKMITWEALYYCSETLNPSCQALCKAIFTT